MSVIKTIPSFQFGGNLDWFNQLRNSWGGVSANPYSNGSQDYLKGLLYKNKNYNDQDALYNNQNSPLYDPNFAANKTAASNPAGTLDGYLAEQYPFGNIPQRGSPEYEQHEQEWEGNNPGGSMNVQTAENNFNEKYAPLNPGKQIFETGVGIQSLMKGQAAFDAKPKDTFNLSRGNSGYKRMQSGGDAQDVPRIPDVDSNLILQGYPGVTTGENPNRDSFAVNTNRNGSLDTGLYQVNSDTFKDLKTRKGKELAKYGIYSYNQMTDPEKNSIVAAMVFQQGEQYNGNGHRGFYGSPLNKRNVENLRRQEVKDSPNGPYLSEMFNPTRKSGGNIPVNPNGLYEENGPVIIPSNRITMKNINQPVMAFPNNDKPLLMHPNKNYNFKNSSSVLEVPFYQGGGLVKRLKDRRAKKKYANKLEDLTKDQQEEIFKAYIATKGFNDNILPSGAAQNNTAYTDRPSTSRITNSPNQEQILPDHADYISYEEAMSRAAQKQANRSTKRNVSSTSSDKLDIINPDIQNNLDVINGYSPTPINTPYVRGSGIGIHGRNISLNPNSPKVNSEGNVIGPKRSSIDPAGIDYNQLPDGYKGMSNTEVKPTPIDYNRKFTVTDNNATTDYLRTMGQRTNGVKIAPSMQTVPSFSSPDNTGTPVTSATSLTEEQQALGDYNRSTIGGIGGSTALGALNGYGLSKSPYGAAIGGVTAGIEKGIYGTDKFNAIAGTANLVMLGGQAVKIGAKYVPKLAGATGVALKNGAGLVTKGGKKFIDAGKFMYDKSGNVYTTSGKLIKKATGVTKNQASKLWEGTKQTFKKGASSEQQAAAYRAGRLLNPRSGPYKTNFADTTGSIQKWWQNLTGGKIPTQIADDMAITSSTKGVINPKEIDKLVNRMVKNAKGKLSKKDAEEALKLFGGKGGVRQFESGGYVLEN